MDLIEEKAIPDGIVYADCFRDHDVHDVLDFHHQRINHSKLFSDQHDHINGIENFWNQAKRHMRRFTGIPRQNFCWFLKECEWRFNGKGHKSLLNQLKRWSKNARH